MVRGAVLALWAALLVPAADFSGRWRADLGSGGHSGVVELELRQTNGIVSGTIWLSGEPRAIAPSRVENGRATLVLLVPQKGRLGRMEAMVRLEGDRLLFEGEASGSARRVPPEKPDRAARLAGLFRVWGAIKFFHPWLAYKEVDWDAALVAAIPAAERATARQPYAAAVARMLAALGDPATRVLPDSELPADSGGGILRRGAAIDLRAGGNLRPRLLSLLPSLIRGEVRLPGIRRIVRQGYYPQNARRFSFYYWDWEVSEGGVVEGHATDPAPLVFHVGERTTGVYDILAALEDAGMATVIEQEGRNGECGEDPYVMELPYGVRVRMRTSELLHLDGSVGFGKARTRPADLDHTEKRYPGALPDRPHRLLALARLWNVVRYFYPYHDLMERSWDALLPEAIPAFEAAASRREYLFAIARLGTHLCDGHVNVAGLWEELGRVPPVEVMPVEGRAVVTHAGGAAGVDVGDVVLAVDGKAPAERIRELLELHMPATPQAAALHAHQWLLVGREPQARVRLLKAGGREVEVMLERTLPYPQPRPRTGPAFRMLPQGFGYIDLTRLENGEAFHALDLVSAAPGLILDLRGYPTQAHAEVAARLTVRRVPRAIVEMTEWHGPDPARAVRRRHHQLGWIGGGPPYRGKVVVLIDARAMSLAEHTCLYFDTAANAAFIGSATAGTNGDVTNTVLPGDVEFRFTGLSVRHADGRQLQRIGVLPHVRVDPTIAGIRAGRDEVLEGAVEFLAAPAVTPVNPPTAAH